MPITMRCSKCRKDFTPNREDARNIRLSHVEILALLRVDCPHCGGFSDCRSLLPDSMKTKASRRAHDETYRCPVAACTGWVSYVEGDDKPFWGCGECGSVWFKRAKFLKEIDQIIVRYPYRKACYRKVKGKWQPGDVKKEPRDYERKVEREEADEGEDYVRG